MKKLCIFLIVIVLTFLSACTAEKKLEKNKLFDINNNSYYDSLEFKTEKKIYSKDDKVIKYYVKNITEDESYINSDHGCFELHMLVDGEWKSVGTKIDVYWTEVALVLPPNQVEKREINLEEYYHLPLDEGTYRICIEGLLSETFEIKH